jgi:hypothetical protein
MPDIILYSYVGYLALFFGLMVCYLWWRSKRRRAKLPFDEKIERVMRTPGESARKKIDQLTDDIIENTFVAFLAPVVILLVHQLFVLWFKPTGDVLSGVAISLPISCLLALGLSVHRISKSLLLRSDWHLGDYGERNVADHLDELREHGWRIFHDVPAERKGKKFNIDHVAVGHAGVFAIETKTPRRPETPARGREAHVVVYDGTMLKWPTGALDDNKSRMAKSRADWLHEWLKSKQVNVPVHPILAIPWWYVKKRNNEAEYEVPALNPGQLVGTLLPRPRALTDSQVAKVSELLRVHCRDVAYR